MEQISYSTDLSYKFKLHVPAFIFLTTVHIGGLCGFYLIFYSQLATVLWTIIWTSLSIATIVVGTHRMYSHKSFKPNSKVVRLVLVGLHTLSGQITIWAWSRGHRVHHKYPDTDADPHNSNRGFFFSHVGWLMCYEHPLALSESRKVDMSDIRADKYVMFQKKNWIKLHVFANLLVSFAPLFLWNETFINCLFVCYFARYTYGLTVTFFINSVSHRYGKRPYDKTIEPTDPPLLGFLTFGEGSHNYHHCFPWDYKGNEVVSRFNVSTRVIELLARFNLVYDLRAATNEMIKSRVAKRGDGSHQIYGN